MRKRKFAQILNLIRRNCPAPRPRLKIRTQVILLDSQTKARDFSCISGSVTWNLRLHESSTYPKFSRGSSWKTYCTWSIRSLDIEALLAAPLWISVYNSKMQIAAGQISNSGLKIWLFLNFQYFIYDIIRFSNGIKKLQIVQVPNGKSLFEISLHSYGEDLTKILSKTFYIQINDLDHKTVWLVLYLNRFIHLIDEYRERSRKQDAWKYISVSVQSRIDMEVPIIRRLPTYNQDHNHQK